MTFVQALVLTAFSCLSLVIALYCLLFMVPVKRFWERIRTLGGGLKGIEAHVDGVRSKVSRRLEEVEERAQQQLEDCRRKLQEGLDKLAQQGRQTRRRLEEMHKELESVREALRGSSTEGRQLARRVQALTGEVQGMRGDLEGLDAELRQSVRRKVADAFSSVESTVLATLEAIQEEILYGVSDAGNRPSGSARPRTGRVPTRGTRGNIITVEPLFANMHRADQEEETAEEGEGAEPTEEEDD